MDGVLRTLSQFPHSSTSVKRVHLVESSPALRAVQEKKLRAWGGERCLELHWHDSIDDIATTDGVYTMLAAPEFFDALPFHLIEKSHQAAKAILGPSGDDPSGDRSPSTSHTRFRPVHATEPSPVSTLLGSSSPRFSSLPIGARVEVSADYGTDHFVRNSFRGHALTDPFDCPMQTDLTANVDFAHLAEALTGTGRSRSASQHGSPSTY
ncbi:S-adenosyl-L-methionine-dependent methyltransferase [Russula decolorans]